MEFNYDVMEEELTCPVCLELYADPLILACSHSMCKKCLEEILNNLSRNLESDGFQCPSCRRMIDLTRDNFHKLPKNLALENIVIRFMEERSKNIRKSLVLEWPFSELLVAPHAAEDGAGRAVTSDQRNCGLCESAVTPSAADLYCVQCDVSYCRDCFASYHPRRGALSRHRIQSLTKLPPEMSFLCSDHDKEQASMFCDRCKVSVCHLCVCDGEGRHAGHKMLAPDTASNMIKTMATKTKDQSGNLLSSLLDERSKVEAYYQEIKDLYKSSCSRIELQCRRVIEDFTAAILQEKQAILQRMDDSRLRVLRQTEAQRADNERCCVILTDLTRGCREVTEEKTTTGILSRAPELQPMIVKMKKHKKEVGFLHRRYESMLKDKSPKLQLLSGTEQFRKRVDKLVTWFLDDGISGSDSIIPHILTVVPPGRTELVPRVQNKYLTTWGFSSTTFTGDSISRACSWTVTVERNAKGIWGCLQTGYLFGVGVASEVLTSKDVVGMSAVSHGLVCSAGNVVFMNSGKQEILTSLDSLPISVSVAVRFEEPDVTILTYKLASVAEGKHITLVGRRVTRDAILRKALYPVFTVSQRVKILFPTYV